MTKKPKAKGPKRMSVTLDPATLDRIAAVMEERSELKTVSQAIAWGLRIATEKGDSK